MKAGDVEAALSDFVSAVVDRLAEQDLPSTALESEWRNLQSTDDEEREYCIAAARLGLDPYGNAASFESGIIRASNVLPLSVQAPFFDAVDPHHIVSSIDWMVSASKLVEEGRNDTTTLELLRRNLSKSSIPSFDQPWQTGWEYARAVRVALDVADTERFDIAPFLRDAVDNGGDRQIKALGLAGESPSGLVVFSRPMPFRSVRFTLARCLWYQAVGTDEEFIITDSYTDRQKIERAFAAELLAPAAGIRDMLTVDADDAQGEDIDAIAEYFEVSTTLIERQLQNQLIGSL